MKSFLKIIKEAVIACILMASCGLIVNAVRSDGLALVADKPYDIFVPCPETLGRVEMIEPTDARLSQGQAYIVDARGEDAFSLWHFAAAMNITYDYLDPIPPEEIKNIVRNIAASGKAMLIVYGDGDGSIGSTGYELGRELAGSGLNNVFVVRGGADALREAQNEK